MHSSTGPNFSLYQLIGHCTMKGAQSAKLNHARKSNINNVQSWRCLLFPHMQTEQRKKAYEEKRTVRKISETRKIRGTRANKQTVVEYQKGGGKAKLIFMNLHRLHKSI